MRVSASIAAAEEDAGLGIQPDYWPNLTRYRLCPTVRVPDGPVPDDLLRFYRVRWVKEQ